MNKPFELTIYPKPHSPRFTYGGDSYGEQLRRERAIVLSKRLTEAELAAELWFAVSREAHAEAMGWRTGHAQDWINTNQEECRIVGILERFATLPHYDEETT